MKMTTDKARQQDPIIRTVLVFLLKLRLADFVLIIFAFDKAASTGL